MVVTGPQPLDEAFYQQVLLDYGPEFVEIARLVEKELIDSQRRYGTFNIIAITKQRVTDLSDFDEVNALPFGLNCEVD